VILLVTFFVLEAGMANPPLPPGIFRSKQFSAADTR
jgi:hypothetical protein